MNAHERRTLERMAERKAATIAEKQNVHPTMKDKSQERTEGRKPTATEPTKAAKKTTRPLSMIAIVAKWTWKLTVFSATVLGVVSGWFALAQRISVIQDGQADSVDPFSARFVVSNDGPLPIENVRFQCGIGHVAYDKGPQVNGADNFGTSFIFLPDANGNLPTQNVGTVEMKAGERSTIPACNYPLPKNVKGADVGIVVSFRVGYVHIDDRRVFRFMTLADSDQKLHWYPFPLK